MVGINELSNGSKHSFVMDRLKSCHESIFSLIQNKKFHYIGYPIHPNIGDLLIMQGTLKFFENYSIKPVSRSSVFNFNPSLVKAGDILVFHGGGNLGDLYPVNQAQRESAVRSFKENRIIFLPQSIHFESQENYAKCCEQFSTHPDLHIFVRDHVSFELAKQMTKNVILSPDMAHQLWPIASKKLDVANTLFIKRQDKEATNVNDIENSYSTDWPLLVGRRRHIATLFTKVLTYIPHSLAGPKIINFEARLWEAYSLQLIERAINLYNRHSKIITNRLHGHILACLMAKENVVLDNIYGKNSRYVEAWTKESDIVSSKLE